MAADWGTPYPLRCTNRPPGRPVACERADRLTLGFQPRGPRRQRGGGPGLGLSPDSGKEASPEGEYRNLRGVELRRKGEGQKDPRGRGLPAGIPEAQPAAPGLKGGSVATKGPQPRRPRPICGGAVRPTGPATARPGHTGPATAPQADYWGHTTSRGRKEEKSGKRWDCVGLDACVDECVGWLCGRYAK
jgi:hypothetical protein